jgi:tetratricopeptide (TPR) repeat protein
MLPNPVRPEVVRRQMRQWMAAGQWAAAEQLASRWLISGGIDWQIRLNLAVCRTRLRLGSDESRLDLAAAAFEQSQAHPAARLGLAELCLDAGFWERATGLLEVMQPSSLSPHQRCSWAVLLARGLARLGRNQDACQILETIPVVERAWPWSLALADTWIQDGCLQKAEVLLRQVLRDHPNLVQAHQNLALLLLSERRCDEAWPHYEWRRSNPRCLSLGPPTPLPTLSQLQDCTVLVLGEQGIGDQIMYSRYLPSLAAVAKRVLVQPDGRLVPLLRRQLPRSIEVLDHGPETGSISPQAAEPGTQRLGMASLPYLFWSSLGPLASQSAGYFQADPARVTFWQAQLRALDSGPLVGLGWLGGTQGSDRRERSLKPEDLGRLSACPGVIWIDLQHLGSNLTIAPGYQQNQFLHRFGDVGEDVEDSLALMACLNTVVTTRQTVAHFAGCIGKAGHVLVPKRPEWRYAGEQQKWDWYPCMHLLQQQQRGNWQTELQEIEKVLRHWFN